NKEPVLYLIKNRELSNVIAKHGAIRVVYPVIDERELLVTCQKVLRRDIFGLDKYVAGWGIALRRFTLKSVADKAPVLSELEGYLTDLEAPVTVVPEMLTVAEELMLNAIVHAPRDEHGEPKYE